MEDSIAIEKPDYSCIYELIALHKKHLLNNLTHEQIKDGFIRVVYSTDDFVSIINDYAIVVAKSENRIIGYYLLGHSTKALSLKYQYEALERYKVNGTNLNELNVACGAQAVLEKEYRGMGLTEKMLQQLVLKIATKYDYLFSSITKLNANALKVHQSSGYDIVGEDETKFFVCLKIGK